MDLLSMDENEQTGFLEKLSICHRRAANGETYGGKPAFRPMGLAVSYLPGDGETSATPASAKPTPDIPRQTISRKQIGSMLVEGINVLSQDGNQKTPQDTAPDRLRMNIDPFGASSAGSIKEATNDRPEVSKDLRPGVWLEFCDNGAKSVERLSWISVVLGSYLFTRQDGIKSRELSAEEMENGLHNGQIVRTKDPSLALISSFDTMLDRLQKKIVG